MIGYILYGRLKSSRLKSKALLTIQGKSLLSVARERISLAPSIEKIVFATSDLAEDTPLALQAEADGFIVHRGHPEDVLHRLYEAAFAQDFDYFVTDPIDTPLQFSELIGATVHKLVSEDLDMVYTPDHPNGTDCYGLKRAAVKKVLEIKQATDTECWGKYFRETGLFRWGQINLFADYPHLKDFRVTIDYPEDYEFFKRLYGDLVTKYGVAFTLADLIRTLDSHSYRQELTRMKTLGSRWFQHFSASQEPVSRDVQRIVANFEGKF